MVDMDNFSEINQNFDTIKTLLNSIRAQGVLNTSDVDKLLTGINTKLEKINTEEDIDMIKIFLSELKQNLDERHGLLISKFGAIEALFSNLLKTSSEMPKSADIKELFDIVATNLSVFSREVVAQKESLTDITLRLDSMRSDDSQKKDIIKNISVVKNDLDRLTNGFDSIVLSLNDNFKNIIRSITDIDSTDTLSKFADNLRSVEMSSNTILSALQVLDKKTEHFENALSMVTTRDDLNETNKRIIDLTAQGQEFETVLSNLSDKYIKIDNLADKIDASVSIIASLKSILEDADNKHAEILLEQIKKLETQLITITTDTKFDDFKISLETVLNKIESNTSSLGKDIYASAQDIQKLISLVNSLEINVEFKNLLSKLNTVETSIKTSIDEATQKLTTLNDANITRVLNDISTGADTLNIKLGQTQTAISALCENNFDSVFKDVSELKNLISQLDENSVSSNNAIFSNITDRLTSFENSLKNSLDAQEQVVSNASAQLIENITSLKDISNVLDYKMDSSVIEVSNVKKEFSTLRDSVEAVLAMDFVNTVKDLRIDLYASKQEMVNNFESTTSDLSENITSDLYGKYELLISKLDSIEEEFKKTQHNSLSDLRETLNNISSSIVDVISYVSESNNFKTEGFDAKITEVTEIIKGTGLTYIENIKDIVEVIRFQVENNIKSIEEEQFKHFDSIKVLFNKNTEDIKQEFKYSYNKLLEIQDLYNEIKSLVNTNQTSSADKIDEILASSDIVKNEFENKLSALKLVLLDKISEFKKEFTCENADKMSELRFSVENLYGKNVSDISGLIENLHTQLKAEFDNNYNGVTTNSNLIIENLDNLNNKIDAISKKDSESRAIQVKELIDNIAKLRDIFDFNNNLYTNTQNNNTAEIIKNIADFREQFENILNVTKHDRISNFNELIENITNIKEQLELYTNLENNNKDLNKQEIIRCISELKTQLELNSNVESNNRDFSTQEIIKNISELKEFCELNVTSDANNREQSTQEIIKSIANLKEQLELNANIEANNNNYLVQEITKDINALKEQLELNASIESNIRDSRIQEILKNIVNLKDFIEQNSSKNSKDILTQIQDVVNDIDNLKIYLEQKLLSETSAQNTKVQEIADSILLLKDNIESVIYAESNARVAATETVIEHFVNLQDLIKSCNCEANNTLDNSINTIIDNFFSVKELLNSINENSTENINKKIEIILENFDVVKTVLNKVDENIDGDMTRQLSIIESNFESLVSQIAILFDKSEHSLADIINSEFSTISDKINDSITSKLEGYKLSIEETFENLQVKANSQSDFIQEKIVELNNAFKSIWQEQAESNNILINDVASSLRNVLDENIKLTAVDYVALKNKLTEYAKNTEAYNYNLTQDIKAQIDDITKYIDSILEINNDEAIKKADDILCSLNTIKENFNNNLTELKTLNEDHLNITKVAQADIAAISQMCANNNTLVEETTDLLKEQHEELLLQDKLLINSSNEIKAAISDNKNDLINVQNNIEILTNLSDSNKSFLASIDTTINEKLINIETLTQEASDNEIQILNSYLDTIKEQLEIDKQQIVQCKELIIDFMKKEFDIISKDIEKESDIIAKDVIEQFDILRKDNADDIVKLTSQIEDIVNTQIYNSIEDLKSYLDVKTDNSIISNKLDNLKLELENSISEMLDNLNKMLDTDVFASAFSDFKLANELLINTSIDNINSKIEKFSSENGKLFEEKLAIFDKKFINTIVEKYEELKVLSLNNNSNFENVQDSIFKVLNSFDETKAHIHNKLQVLADSLQQTLNINTNEIKNLTECFENLRSQISNKSFDEAFQASINKQISNLENLINEQLSYIEDINELCSNNLPDVTELNTLVKHSILESIKTFSEKLDNNNVTEQLSQVKTDIITQLLNVFNQISFITEQEEILDFIQIKHDELITILSHIVTSTNDISEVKENITNLKDEIEIINDKISAIISSDGDIDYVYSLHELENDIASLRIALNEIKNNGHDGELVELINSTNNIYNLVEALKSDLPSKDDFENMAEDLVSISSRTNKLLLASDESYKSLNDNLKDFKMVINDLDERTRNFAQESGMDKIDSKLNAINTMIVNGSKTNQVFNQIFEYLAEWVDQASVQINSISDRVETLDEIGQIKLMLADMKAESDNDTESLELIEALGNVFEKQTKRIAALENKLDKIIVETTINNQNSSFDITPIENTLNKFLTAMENKLSLQQDKIDSLESKLENIIGVIDNKETSQLTKKVGGMDKQIAKLNKSIEKIASHVIEK